MVDEQPDPTARVAQIQEHRGLDALAGGRKLSDFETKNRAGAAAAPKAKKAAGKKKRGGTVKYRDDAGHTWSGFGPKPGWFKQALAAGKTPESMAV